MNKPLEEMSRKELDEIGRQHGVVHLKERKKAELIRILRQAGINREFVLPPGKKLIGYFCDGSPILEDIK